MSASVVPGSKLRGWLAALAASFVLPATSLAQESVQEIPMSPLESGHLTVDIMLNGEGPFPFVIDTGASHTAVVLPLAARFGFQTTQSEVADVQTLTESVVSERFVFQSISLADIERTDVNAVIVRPVMHRSLPVLGLLGSDVLEGQSFEIDYGAQTLRLNHPGPEHRDGRIDPIFNILVGHGQIHNQRQPVRVLVDTGASRTIINNRLARWARRQNFSLRMQVGGATRLSRMVNTEGYARVARFKIGGLCLPPFIALEADVDIFRALGWEDEPAMVLGMDVLQHTVLTIDHVDDAFELSPASDFASCSSRRRVQVPQES